MSFEGDDRRVGFLERLGYEFSDPELLETALRHRSWCAENEGGPSNERLELLGDAVLGLAVTAHIYEQHPELSEGDLARMRASLVNTTVLAEVATEIELGAELSLGRGENLSGGREKHSILADGLEAVFGAVFVEAGNDVASHLILRLLGDRVGEAAQGPGGFDAKTQLQELVARRGNGASVSYRLTESGPDHAKSFEAEVVVGDQVMGRGHGRSKKRAEQMAARQACEILAADDQKLDDSRA